MAASPDEADDLAGPEGEDQTKAGDEPTGIQPDVPKGMQKVDLDLDDAPFLADEEEPPEPEPEPQPAQPEAVPEETVKPPLWKDKRVLIGAAALLVIVAAALFFLLKPKSKEETPPPPPVEEKVEAKEEHHQPEPPPPPPPVPVTIKIAPFIVEQMDRDGQPHFLSLKFTTSTTSEPLVAEINRKMLVLRDAVYYYLRNKSLDFLSDTKNIETVKNDIVTVMNQYLGSDQIETILIEEYLIK